MTNSLYLALVILLLVERLGKVALVERFFRRQQDGGRWTVVGNAHGPPSTVYYPPSTVTNTPRLVSILQPILSGDPTLAACLEANLQAKSGYNREFLWLVDTDDAEGQRICRDLIDRYSHQQVELLLLPPPSLNQNPKMIKLIAGARQACGDVLCVLDDDTRLPDGGLEQCLPYLDGDGVGLVFGLPYYLSFHNLWSRLVAYFVNSHSLITYIPYTAFAQPMTINGMFYAMRRDVVDAIGGFDGLEPTLADDFAVARRVRGHGLRLVQTPLCHSISTHVAGPRRYLSIIQRWFIFPRESLLRHLPLPNLLLLYGLAGVPVFFPWLALAAALLATSVWTVGFALLYFALNYAIFAYFNIRYFANAAPWKYSWLVPLIHITFPIQLIVALLAPQRITWRGHQMIVERGGGFRFKRRAG